MDDQIDGARVAQGRTSIERKGDLELVVTRTFDAPSVAVYTAWSQPELFQLWWMPKSASGVSLVSCEMDVRTGGKYRLEFAAGGSDTMAFHGKYLDVVPDERIVWTNDEDQEGAVTTVTFVEQGAKTLVTFHEIYPSKEALEEAMQGSAVALPEQLEQLGELLSATGSGAAVFALTAGAAASLPTDTVGGSESDVRSFDPHRDIRGPVSRHPTSATRSESA